MNKAIRIYRDSVLVKQEEMLRTLDMEYDGFIQQVRLKQDEIKRKIKLLFYKEINYIDNVSKYGNNGEYKSIINNENVNNIHSSSNNHTNDSSDIPILEKTTNNNKCNKICNKNNNDDNKIDFNQILQTQNNPSSSTPTPSLPPLPTQLQLGNINYDTNISLDPKQTLQYLQKNNPQIFNNVKSILSAINNNAIHNDKQQQNNNSNLMIPESSPTSNKSITPNLPVPNLPDLIKYLKSTK